MLIPQRVDFSAFPFDLIPEGAVLPNSFSWNGFKFEAADGGRFVVARLDGQRGCQFDAVGMKIGFSQAVRFVHFIACFRFFGGVVEARDPAGVLVAGEASPGCNSFRVQGVEPKISELRLFGSTGGLIVSMDLVETEEEEGGQALRYQ